MLKLRAQAQVKYQDDLKIFLASLHIVKVKTCRQSKDADSKFAQNKDAKGNLQPTTYVYEKD